MQAAQRAISLAVVGAVTCAVASVAHAEDDARPGIAYGTAAAELAAGGVIAIHLSTDSSPGRGVGLALNFVPLVAGVGGAILGETMDLDPRPALGMHGALIGGLPLLAIGAAVDGRRDGGARLGPAALTLGAAGLLAGAYLGATRIETTTENIAVVAAPFAGALGGGLTFAIVHFFDDEGRSTGRLLRYAGTGMLAGTVGSLIYAWPDRATSSTSMRAGPLIGRSNDGTVLSFGGVF